MAGTLPPFFVITDDSHSGYVAVAVYTILVLMAATVLTRLYARWYIARSIFPDDILLGVGASILVQQAMSNGLGQKYGSISSGRFDLFLKFYYAAQILLIMTVALAKLSLGLLFKNMMSGWAQYANYSLIGVVIAWAVGSIFALAFRCSFPTTWKWAGPGAHCIDQSALLIAIEIVNILTDVALVILPCMVLRSVQLPWWHRFRIMALLATRFGVCIATGFQIHYNILLFKSADITWAAIESTVWDQAMMNISLITTALPSLGRLLIDLQPNLHSFPVDPPDDQANENGARTNRTLSFGKSLNRDFDMNKSLGSRAAVLVTSAYRDEPTKDDGDSTEGLVPCQPNVIQQTTHFEVSEARY